MISVDSKCAIAIFSISPRLAGAGAASIAGIEFSDNENFVVEVVGFGCPALLSKDLATKVDYVTVSD